MSFLTSLDLATVEYIAEHRTPLGVLIAFLATDVGSTGTIIVLTVLFALYFALKHRRLVLPLIITVLGSVASFEIIKDIVERPRPPLALAVYNPPLYSFPSGHATEAIAFYGFIAYFVARGRKATARYCIYGAATLFILLIGYSRIYLGVHYPTDVIAGYLLGGLWLWIGITISTRHA